MIFALARPDGSASGTTAPTVKLFVVETVCAEEVSPQANSRTSRPALSRFLDLKPLSQPLSSTLSKPGEKFANSDKAFDKEAQSGLLQQALAKVVDSGKAAPWFSLTNLLIVFMLSAANAKSVSGRRPVEIR